MALIVDGNRMEFIKERFQNAATKYGWFCHPIEQILETPGSFPGFLQVQYNSPVVNHLSRRIDCYTPGRATLLQDEVFSQLNHALHGNEDEIHCPPVVTEDSQHHIEDSAPSEEESEVEDSGDTAVLQSELLDVANELEEIANGLETMALQDEDRNLEIEQVEEDDQYLEQYEEHESENSASDEEEGQDYQQNLLLTQIEQLQIDDQADNDQEKDNAVPPKIVVEISSDEDEQERQDPSNEAIEVANGEEERESAPSSNDESDEDDKEEKGRRFVVSDDEEEERFVDSDAEEAEEDTRFVVSDDEEESESSQESEEESEESDSYDEEAEEEKDRNFIVPDDEVESEDDSEEDNSDEDSEDSESSEDERKKKARMVPGSLYKDKKGAKSSKPFTMTYKDKENLPSNVRGATSKSHHAKSFGQHEAKSVNKSLISGIAFKRQRDKLARETFNEFNKKVFGNRLPSDMEIVWSVTLKTTAGKARTMRVGSTRSATIELATKVVDDTYRLQRTLCHEMIHAANWIIDKLDHIDHGPAFKAWAQIAMDLYPHLDISTCHNYTIHYKYEYECEKCKLVYGRHSKSIDIESSRCTCGGKLHLKSNGRTPRKPTAFSLFVKDNFSAVKKANPGTPHKQLMSVLSERWKQQQVTSS